MEQDKILQFPSAIKKSYGVLESLISAGIFFLPNLLLFFEGFRNNLFIFVLYNYIIIFLLVSTIANLKFRKI